MKIVVRNGKSIGVGWYWVVIGDNGKQVSTSYHDYHRKSDAKRGAERFEDKLFGEYIKWDEGGYKTMEQPIAIEVLD